jgi:nucleotide-binding universal stress UspA family protein
VWIPLLGKEVEAMIEIRRILCPTDLSDLSRRAFEHAVALARGYESEIKVVHVLEPILPGPGPTFYPSWKVLNPGVREQIEGEMAAMTSPAAESGVSVDCSVREGGATNEILEEARTLPADMVVMGTHGRSGFERWFLGSVTEKVMRKAPCPVLTVPPLAEGLHPQGASLFGRILCPLDFSAPSDHALRYALSLAQEWRSEIVLVHVLEWPLAETAGGEPAWFDSREYRRFLEDDAHERLEQAVSDDARVWCRTDQVLASGKPWREVLRTAEERRTDLIVMGVRGRGRVDLALFGSTTQNVVRGAHCPVLVIHSD